MVSFSETRAQELGTGQGNMLTPRKVLPFTNASHGQNHPARPVSAPAPSGADSMRLPLAAKKKAAVEANAKANAKANASTDTANARATLVLSQKLEAERWEMTSGWRVPISRKLAQQEDDIRVALQLQSEKGEALLQAEERIRALEEEVQEKKETLKVMHAEVERLTNM